MVTSFNGLRVASILLLGALAGCVRSSEGTATTQTRTVEAFHSIELRGAATLDVLVGEQQSLVVEGDGEVLQRLTTQVRNDRLVIESRRSWWQGSSGRLRIRVTVPQLRALELNGAGQISINGLQGGSLALVLSGAGELEASGRVATLSARVNGAGSIDLSRLEAVDAEVAVNGTGSLEVNASGQLDAALNGVGSITYGGKPAKLNSSINGIGSIKPR